MPVTPATTQNSAQSSPFWSPANEDSPAEQVATPSQHTEPLAVESQHAADLEIQRQRIVAQDSAQNQKLLATLAKPENPGLARIKQASHIGQTPPNLVVPGLKTTELQAKIFDAIKQKNAAKLEDLLKSVEVLQLGVNAEKNSILFAAIECCDVRVMITVVNAIPENQRAALLLQTNKYGRTPLHVALVLKQPALVTALLNMTPKDHRLALLSQPDLLGVTPLIDAIRFEEPGKELGIVTTLLDKVPEEQRIILLSQPGPDRKTPLHLAVERRHLVLVTTLLNAVPANQRFMLAHNSGKTLLHLAVEYEQADIVTAVFTAVPTGQHLALLLAAENNGQTPLHLAATKNNIPLMAELLKFVPADQLLTCVQQPDTTGQTPLRLAVASGNIELVTALLNAIPEKQRQDGVRQAKTLLHCALQQPLAPSPLNKTRFQMVQLLLANGADVSALDDQKKNALIRAVELQDASVLALLLDPQSTELMHADDAQLNDLLKRTDIAIDAFDNRGWNALMYAIDSNDKNVIEKLQKHGANIDLTNSMLEVYQQSLHDQLPLINSYAQQHAIGIPLDSAQQNKRLLLQLRLEQDLEAARKNKPPSTQLIERLEKALRQIAQLLPAR